MSASESANRRDIQSAYFLFYDQNVREGESRTLLVGFLSVPPQDIVTRGGFP